MVGLEWTRSYMNDIDTKTQSPFLNRAAVLKSVDQSAGLEREQEQG